VVVLAACAVRERLDDVTEARGERLCRVSGVGAAGWRAHVPPDLERLGLRPVVALAHRLAVPHEPAHRRKPLGMIAERCGNTRPRLVVGCDQRGLAGERSNDEHTARRDIVCGTQEAAQTPLPLRCQGPVGIAQRRS